MAPPRRISNETVSRRSKLRGVVPLPRSTAARTVESEGSLVNFHTYPPDCVRGRAGRVPVHRISDNERHMLLPAPYGAGLEHPWPTR